MKTKTIKNNNDMKQQNIFEWYQEQAKRTCVDLKDEKLNLCHMALGMISEHAEELSAQDVINDLEEIADGIFYLANYCSIRNYKLKDFMQTHSLYSSNLPLLATDDELEFSNELEVIEGEMELVNRLIAYGELQDIIKKFIAYNKPIDVNQEKEILFKIGGGYLASVERLFIDDDLEMKSEKELMNHILTSNIEKLKVRYPEKFTEENALNRNLEAERKVLEV